MRKMPDVPSEHVLKALDEWRELTLKEMIKEVTDNVNEEYERLISYIDKPEEPIRVDDSFPKSKLNIGSNNR